MRILPSLERHCWRNGHHEGILFVNKEPALTPRAWLVTLALLRNKNSRLVEPRVLHTPRDMDAYLTHRILPELSRRGFSEEVSVNFDYVVRELVKNGFQHPPRAAYHPTLQTHAAGGLAWVIVDFPDPRFDPYQIPWQIDFDPARLLEENGRSPLYHQVHADFSTLALTPGHAWRHYAAVFRPNDA